MNGRRISLSLITLLMASGLVLWGCSGPTAYQMDPGQRTASSEGEMLVEYDSNGNMAVQMSVAHLPPPSRLEEGMSTFVVWLQPEGASGFYNMGQLRIGDDRSGSINFTTPFEAFVVRVTAEASATAMSPSDQEVLRRGIGMD